MLRRAMVVAQSVGRARALDHLQGTTEIMKGKTTKTGTESK